MRGFSSLLMLITGLVALTPAARAGAAPGILTPPQTSGKPLVVKAGLFISNLSGIHEGSQTFDLDGYLILSWQDSRLARPEGGNGSRSYKPDEIWEPPLQFANAYVPVAILSSTRGAQPDGQVTWVQRFQAHLSTRLWLRRFPFDSQRLTLVILSYDPNGPIIRFEHDRASDGISDEGHVGLAEWRLRELTMTSGFVPLFNWTTMAERVSRAEFALEVSRRPEFYVWKGLLPIALMVAVAFGVFWIDEQQFDWQAKIVFTMMLTLVTFSFAISGFLPRVDYLTFFDAVFLVSFVFAFFVMIELIAVRTMVRAGKLDRAVRIQHLARYLFPLSYLLMLGVLMGRFFLADGPP